MDVFRIRMCAHVRTYNKKIGPAKHLVLKSVKELTKSCFSDFFSISLHRSSEIENCTTGKLSFNSEQDADGGR